MEIKFKHFEAGDRVSFGDWALSWLSPSVAESLKMWGVGTVVATEQLGPHQHLDIVFEKPDGEEVRILSWPARNFKWEREA